MKSLIKTILCASALSVCGLYQASAQVTAVNIGTGLPPATLGPYLMVPFDPGSIAGTIQATMVGGNGAAPEDNWNTWGQLYTGNVYATFTANVITLTLHGPVEAVDFYEEPTLYADFTMTATDSSGASISTVINGFHGSGGIGFYEDSTGGSYLTSITVTTDPSAGGEAIGEFGIDGGTLTGGTGGSGVPDNGLTLAMMALGLAGLGVYARRTANA